METPAWSGLPNNVEKIVRERQAIALVADSKLIQGTGDEGSTSKEDSKAHWLVELDAKCTKLLESMPLQFDQMHRTKDSINNPIFRFVLREVTVASKLLDTVRGDLKSIKEMCVDGKSTNMLRQLAKELYGDLIPTRWRKFIIANITATEWINDFNNRVNQLQKLSTASDLGKSGLWFGGMLFPEAYLTATRQKIA